jgi:hypothetical protein
MCVVTVLAICGAEKPVKCISKKLVKYISEKLVNYVQYILGSTGGTCG